MFIQWWDILLRLGLAIAVGFAVGLEREKHHRPAGIKTHIMVCMGAAIVSLIQLHMAQDATAWWMLIRKWPPPSRWISVDWGAGHQRHRIPGGRHHPAAQGVHQRPDHRRYPVAGGLRGSGGWDGILLDCRNQPRAGHAGPHRAAADTRASFSIA